MNDFKPARVGHVKEITSLSNPIIKEIRALSLKKNRDRTSLFIGEGMKLVIDALDLGWTLKTLIYAKSARDNDGVETIATRAVAAGSLVLEVSEKVLAAITRRDNPQTVVGIFQQEYHSLEDLCPKPDETLVALDRVRDPGNLGTIIRTADAAGASGVILIGETTDPFSLETVRATMGSIFAKPIYQCSIEGFKAWHEKSKCYVVGTHLEGATDYRKITYVKKPLVILMGNEQKGLPSDLSSDCNELAKIPQQGNADSLNLAIATGVMLFEARRHLLHFDPT